MMLHFRDPANLKTKKIVFEEAYAACDSATLEQLKELSSKRRILEESTNESSPITKAIAREMSGGLTSQSQQVLQKLELYLPVLENLFFHIDLISSNEQIVQWTSELKIQWTSALSSSSFFNFGGSKYFQIDNLQFEIVMTLFLYGAILRERASEVLPSDLLKSATLFREAAGVYHYLAHQVLPSLQPSVPVEKPPEVVPSVSTVMSLICLAEAQAVTIKRAEEKGTTVGLLAKLHHGVVELLDEAACALHTASMECKDISSRFVEFITSCKALHELKSQKYLAESLKNNNDGQFGVSVGLLRRALINAKRKIPSEESWKSVFKKEIDDFAELLRKHEHENEFVWHEKIPSGDELPKPEGTKIASVIPYNPKRWERELAFKI
ncbi:putative BRO1 domain-containing protein [Rosa chinensis]|uniref:Putative BRO1 domain-containing protein n=1 Tax=Rosa chinensis TaxID=74649 RepID=A0A2P6R1U5_ROSCH|nr:programmed cell death 6-interacting protein [Rosa chinensis]PRQ40410.1 putative BRO1 domain-containing protein [Rosa chinensis]